jgi:hypothetical protein
MVPTLDSNPAADRIADQSWLQALMPVMRVMPVMLEHPPPQTVYSVSGPSPLPAAIETHRTINTAIGILRRRYNLNYTEALDLLDTTARIADTLIHAATRYLESNRS